MGLQTAVVFEVYVCVHVCVCTCVPILQPTLAVLAPEDPLCPALTWSLSRILVSFATHP